MYQELKLLIVIQATEIVEHYGVQRNSRYRETVGCECCCVVKTKRKPKKQH